MNILFTICGRAGSKGLANKNLKKLANKPLVGYALSLINLFGEANPAVNYEIGLNTDSEALINLVESINENVKLVQRKPELATDVVGKIEVIRDTFINLSENKDSYDFIIDLDITSPLRTLCDLENLVYSHSNNQDKDVYFSVVPSRRNPYFNMVKEVGDKVSIVNKSTFTARQQAPRVFDMNASMYSFKPDFLLNSHYIFSGEVGMIQMKDYLILDIDSEEDFEWLNFLFPKFLEDSHELLKVYKN
ncbi:acylneuraminate cytidylyltransferase family protein [Candidatus Enterococcus ferrettii]|uniref:N-acylneuraminate cytidylyltransferase n=1 Tax=Candidatus Enterococcus ferrettii TaxID=2815324 RepID=A0ABV0EWF3_9ENTE|nr:acylneuraminate cytidylyltransferase family protein [Enterococcus sp. 665A]MBO1342783.1 acylneuraminate cytidylyltransferase family protein [Enterococcus sp. 665A]